MKGSGQVNRSPACLCKVYVYPHEWVRVDRRHPPLRASHLQATCTSKAVHEFNKPLYLSFSTAHETPKVIETAAKFTRKSATMPTTQSAEFKKAIEDSRKLQAKPSDDELLQVAHQDPPEHFQPQHWLTNTCRRSSTPSSSKAPRTRRSRSRRLRACLT